MSEQEDIKTEQPPSEEQPAAEKEAAAAETEPEQKPDISEGEKPSETQKEAAPKDDEPAKTESEAPKEGEPAAVEQEEEEPEEEEPDDGVPIVLVTGASGFIATHLIKQLLEQGRYHVRGTVRSKKKEEKVKPLLGLVPQAKYPLRLVEADLSKPETWTKAVKRCSYVFHVASPFPPGAANEAALVKTAVEGTTTVLQACADAATVKRVVVTSSIAAISAGTVGDPEKAADYVYTEKDWSVEAVCTPYVKSKLKAERAAWDFVKALEESKRFELAVVNPAYVQGPLLSASSGEGSKEYVQRLLNGKMLALADVSTSIVDVRDVAAAHIAAMEKSEAAGNRYILSSRTIPFKEFAQIIGNEFRPQGYKITSRIAPKAFLWVSKFFDPEVKEIYSSVGKNVQLSNDRMVNELGIQPRPVEESIIDTCYSLIELGLAKKTPGYLGHPSTRPPPPEPQDTNKEVAAAKDESQTKPQEETQQESQPESVKEQDKPGESQPATTEGEKTEDKQESSVTEPAATEGEEKTEDKPVEPEPSVAEPAATEGEEKTEDKPVEPEPSVAEPAATEGEDKPAEPEPSVAEPAATNETSVSQPPAEDGEESEDKPAEGDTEEQQTE